MLSFSKKLMGIAMSLIALAGCSKGFQTSSSSSDPQSSSLANTNLAQAIADNNLKIVFLNSSIKVQANVCSPLVSIQLQTTSGSPFSFEGFVGLDMSASTGGSTFFTDSSCSKAVSQPILTGGGSSEATFYFTAPTTGSVHIQASLLGLLTASQNESIVPAVSPSGTTIPTVTEIVDSSDNIWTLQSGIVYENGSLAGYSAGVILLLYYKDVIYQENSANNWYSWNGSSWLAMNGDPRGGPSPSPTPSISPSPSPSVSASASPSPSPSVSPSPSPSVSHSPSPSPSASTGVELPGPSAALLANPTYGLGIGKVYTCVRNFYVNGTSGNDSNPGTQSSPWKTIQNADTTSRTGGDCINVAPGTYPTQGILLQHGGTQASATGYVTYRCQTLDGCHVLFTGGVGGHLWMFQGAPYIVVDGFEIDGNESAIYGGLADTCLESLQMSPWWVVSHHIWMLNNKVHGCNLSGLGFQSTEYIFALHNEVYNTAWTSGYQGSGIGFVVMQPLGAGVMGETFDPNPYPIYTPTAQDLGFAPFHIIIAFNDVHENGCTTCLGSKQILSTTGNTHSNTTLDGLASTKGLANSQLVVGPGIAPMTYIAAISGSTVTLTRPATASGNGGTYQFLSLSTGHTDGNGIILDTWVGGVGRNDHTYPYQSLVLGNLSYSNGGRGIHVFATDYATVANNSVYGNGLDLYDDSYYFADLSQAGGQSNVWVNNIAQSVLTQANPGCGQYCGNRNAPLVAGDGRGVTDLNNTYIHNVLVGGDGVQLFGNDVTYFSTSNNKVNTNPLFVNPAHLLFQLQSSSPAMGYGQPESYIPAWLKNAGAY